MELSLVFCFHRFAVVIVAVLKKLLEHRYKWNGSIFWLFSVRGLAFMYAVLPCIMEKLVSVLCNRLFLGLNLYSKVIKAVRSWSSFSPLPHVHLFKESRSSNPAFFFPLWIWEWEGEMPKSLTMLWAWKKKCTYFDGDALRIKSCVNIEFQ